MREINRSGTTPKPYARTTFLGVRIEHLSDTIKRSIERGTDTIARAARRGAMVGGAFGSLLGVLILGVGIMIGRTL